MGSLVFSISKQPRPNYHTLLILSCWLFSTLQGWFKCLLGGVGVRRNRQMDRQPRVVARVACRSCRSPPDLHVDHCCESQELPSKHSGCTYSMVWNVHDGGQHAGIQWCSFVNTLPFEGSLFNIAFHFSYEIVRAKDIPSSFHSPGDLPSV